MRKHSQISPITILTLVALFSILLMSNLVVSANAGPVDKGKKRPYFEYKGNYGDEIDGLKEQFKQAYGYELFDLDRRWSPDEIKKIHAAFSSLPPGFLNLKGLKGFYRVNHLQLERGTIGEEGIFAGTFPRYSTVYRQASRSYNVEVQNEPVRIEFYNDVFYLDAEQFDNIVHHEMAHAYDLTHGFLSFQKEWLDITGFQIVHIPALDGQPHNDFLFVLADDVGRSLYGPVSSMQMVTHSRENPQEDFANSVAGFLHYPFFRFTHPKRYAYIKDNVFGGSDSIPKTLADSAASDSMDLAFQKALDNRNWKDATGLLMELSRQNLPEVDKKFMDQIESFAAGDQGMNESQNLAVLSCYLFDDRALLFRQKLWQAGKVDPDKLLKDNRCAAMSKKSFQDKLSPMPVFRLYYYKENGQDWVQFLDPVVFVSQARGFQSKYKWRITLAGDNDSQVLGEGETKLLSGLNGAVKINLQETLNPKFNLQFPEGRPVNLQVWVERKHPKFQKVFPAPPNGIQFVVNPWFRYKPLHPVAIRVVFPPGIFSTN